MTKLILPTPSQAEWAEREIGVIIHLDLPVFSDDVHYNFRDHYGDPLPAALFNPDDMDVESWVKAARDLGARASACGRQRRMITASRPRRGRTGRATWCANL